MAAILPRVQRKGIWSIDHGVMRGGRDLPKRYQRHSETVIIAMGVNNRHPRVSWMPEVCESGGLAVGAVR
jgi:hypothetical protein